MNRPLSVVLLLCVVAAGLLWLVLSRVASEGDAALEARMAELEREVVLLREQVGAMQPRSRLRGGALAEPGLVPDSFGGPEARRLPAEEVVESLAEALDSDDPQVRQRLEAVVRDQMEQQQSEAWEARREAMEARAREEFEQFKTEVGLTTAQGAELETMLGDEREQIFALFRGARQDYSFREARQQARATREATDERAAELLNSQQYERFLQWRDEERDRRRGR
jgi:hypothetical protein